MKIFAAVNRLVNIEEKMDFIFRPPPRGNLLDQGIVRRPELSRTLFDARLQRPSRSWRRPNVLFCLVVGHVNPNVDSIEAYPGWFKKNNATWLGCGARTGEKVARIKRCTIS